VSRYAASLRAFGRVFANRSVRNIQIAEAGSVLGTYAYSVALPVYAYHSGGYRAVGLLFFARLGLAAVAAPWLGVLADRWSRRRLMLAADAARTAIFAAMTAVASTHAPAFGVYALAVASTVISGCYPPAQAALLPSLVETPEELTAANLVGNTLSSLAMFVGPAIGAVLLVLSGPAAVFALNGAFFLWSIAFVVQIPRDDPPARSEHARFLPELAAGFSAVLHRPALRVVVGLTAAQSAVEGALNVLLVVLAIQLLHAGNAGFGWLTTAMGVGSVLGAAAVAVLSTRRLAGGFAAGILCWGVPLAVAAAATTLPLGLLLVGLLGVGATVVPVNGTTLLQRAADKDVIGRVFAVLEGLILGAMALGALVAPGLVSWLGPRGALVASGVLLPALLLPLWPTLRRIDAEAEPALEPLALLRGIGFLAELPEPVLERLAGAATLVSAAPGQPVVTRGDPGHHFYVVAAGRAEVELTGEERRELGQGDSFGEIALLRDVPRTATVRALDALRLFAIARDDFLAAVTGHAPTLEAAESVVVSRMPVGSLG
jgi:MFS family permease